MDIIGDVKKWAGDMFGRITEARKTLATAESLESIRRDGRYLPFVEGMRTHLNLEVARLEALTKEIERLEKLFPATPKTATPYSEFIRGFAEETNDTLEGAEHTFTNSSLNHLPAYGFNEGKAAGKLYVKNTLA